ncbi:MAG: amidohydrolase family protein [Acidobacteria bacterium]|nr:amidohydrolase family protein [Acidobacteriota bacterium]
MKGSIAGALLVLAATPLLAQPYDLLIRNGRIVDGAGNPWYYGDIAVKGDRIAAMGSLQGATATKTIDATGKVIAPGFLDIHSHSNDAIFDRPDAENQLRQGVTTLFDGNDGGGALPLGPFLDKLRQTPLGVNYGSFVGHNAVRREVIGLDDRLATPEELDRMRALVDQGMRDGAMGLSTGLFYLPGTFAPTEEVIELAKVAARYGGMHISHMRDEGDKVVEASAEIIEIGEKGGLPTQLTHHKAMGKSAWGSSEKTLAMVDAARARGVDVTIDQYPYTASQTGSAALFPAWALEGGRDSLLERLRAPEQRQKIKEVIADRIEFNRGGGDPKNIQFSSCRNQPDLAGKTLADATRAAGREVTFDNAAETAIEIEIAGGCSNVYHSMDEEDVRRILRSPATMIASDGGIRRMGDGVPHPRSYGTFARVLGRYVREQHVITLEDAIRKMTSLPAGRLKIFDRGLLRPGMLADIVVFDPETVTDRAEFGNPHQMATGYSYVIVNGQMVIDDGKMTAARPGRVLVGPGAVQP